MTRQLLEYCIVIREQPDAPLKERTVAGAPVKMPVPGTFAVRRIEAEDGECWVMDHVETGCRVAKATTRSNVITATLRIAARLGADGFERAYRSAEERRRRDGLPAQQEAEELAA